MTDVYGFFDSSLDPNTMRGRHGNVGDRQSGGFVASIKLFGFDENLMEIRGAVPLLGVSPL